MTLLEERRESRKADFPQAKAISILDPSDTRIFRALTKVRGPELYREITRALRSG